MKDNLVETIIGAVVIAISVVFVGYGYSVSDSGDGTGVTIRAEFDRVDGLIVGSDVRLSGIKIGTVSSLDLDPATYFAVVNMFVRPDIELPEDTSAKITSEGLLGGNYVSITPGGSEDMLADGDEILYTQGSVDLIGLVSQALFSAGSGDSE